MKKYLVFTLKKFLPFLIICAAVFIALSISLFSGVEVADKYYEYNGELSAYGSLDGPKTIIVVLAVFLFGFTCVAPIIANAYRNSLRSADFYNQIGKGHMNVRLIHNLTLLGAVLISFTIAYILGVAVLTIKDIAVFAQGETREVLIGTEEYVLTIPFMYHIAYFIPIYFFLVIGAVINFFISYFLVTRANNALNSIITLAFGQGILMAGLMTPLWYTNVLLDGSLPVSFLLGVKTPSMISIVALTIYLFGDLLRGNPFAGDLFIPANAFDYVGLVLAIISVLIYFLFGAYSIYKFFTGGESSGELAGKPQGRDNLQMIIFHIGAGLFGLWDLVFSGSLNDIEFMPLLGVFSFIPSVIIYGALYYVFYGIERRNFRLIKKDLYILLPFFLTNVALAVTSMIVRSNIYLEL